MPKRGRPQKFKSGEDLIDLFSKFCDDIVDGGYRQIPSQTNFCKWLGVNYDGADRKTIYNALNKYFPDIKKDFERLQSDLLAQGGMLGKWQPAMTIFTLRNWCKWTDKPINDDGADSDSEAHTELVNAIKKAIKE